MFGHKYEQTKPVKIVNLETGVVMTFYDIKKVNINVIKGERKMSSSFNQRYERKFNGVYRWSNPIWRRHRLKQLRAKHQRREMFQENPNWLQERYPNWDWRTETDRRLESTVGRY
jgi:hypothetical protein